MFENIDRYLLEPGSIVTYKRAKIYYTSIFLIFFLIFINFYSTVFDVSPISDSVDIPG